VRPPRALLPPPRWTKQRPRKIGAARYVRECPRMFPRNLRGCHYLRSRLSKFRQGKATTFRALAIRWDFERREQRTRSSSVNIRHHRHRYHITTATMVNTTDITPLSSYGKYRHPRSPSHLQYASLSCAPAPSNSTSPPQLPF